MSSGMVLVSGSSNTDLVITSNRLPGPGETVAGSSFAVYAGGKAANQAVAAARAGARVAFAGAVGEDEYGSARLAELATEGIDPSFISVLPDVPSGLALIIVDGAGNNQITTFGGANEYIHSTSLESAIVATDPAVFLCTLEVPVNAIEVALNAASQTSATVILNAAPYDEVAKSLLSRTDILICNSVEAGQLAQRTVNSENAAETADDLLELGPASVIITLGADGAVMADREQAVQRFPAMSVEVVDTTGAGDAFCGVLASWIAEGHSLAQAIQAAIAASSLAVQTQGAQPSLPSRDRILKMLERSGFD